MNLKQEILAGLQKGTDGDALLGVVKRQLAAGLSPKKAYDSLHELWLEFGFDRNKEGSNLQNDLEYVMERTWLECTAPNV